MKNVSEIGARIARGAAVLAMLAGGLGITAAEAAPLGVPAATTGAGKTTVGGEVNILLDRDLTGPGGLQAESSQVYAKGTIGVDDRLDLVFRLGFGDFSVDPGGFNTDMGPAFGAGFNVTWANLPEANLKIGSVFQTLRIRAEDANSREAWTEYDAALGVSMDTTASKDPKKRQTQFGLVPYAGFAWSGAEWDGLPVEDTAFGLFLGFNAKAQGNFNFGVELRLVDQTALSLGASMAF